MNLAHYIDTNVDGFFDDFFFSSPRKGFRQKATYFSPRTDISESKSHFLLSLDLPGLAKDNISIDVKDGTLTISGNHEEKRKEDRKQGDSESVIHISERTRGRFRRSFSLPESTDSETIEADYQDGVLRIAIPKAPELEPKQVKIGTGSSKLLGLFRGKHEST